MHTQAPQSSHRQGGSRGFINKQQRKYVPKTSPESSNADKGHRNPNEIRNGLLTSSLRQDGDKSHLNHMLPGAQGNKIDSNSGTSSKQREQGRFVKYLPQDEEGGMDPEETQGVADLLNHELSVLLKMKPRDFWKAVARDDSLEEFLDSYLQFRKRWYDLYHCGQSGSMAGLVVGDQELCRRVFMVLYRMSSNQDPGAPARESLSSKEHTDLLLGKRLLDIPKLMDIAAIYGHENSDLTQSLVLNALKSQPGLADRLKGVIPQFLLIVDTMDHRCSSSLEVLSSKENEISSVRQLHGDLWEVLDFINDAVVTLDAFVEAYAPAAPIFISSGVSKEGNQELLPMLAYMHDTLLPVVEKGLNLTTENTIKDSSDNLELGLQPCLKILCARIVRFAWQLLYSCYLTQTFSDNNSYHSSSMIFPAQVEDPGIRGEITVQIIGEMVARSNSVDGLTASGTFLWNLDRRHKLMNKIDELCQNGWMHLNEAQYGYISQLAGHSEPQKLRKYKIDERAPDISSLSLKDKVNLMEETVILESKISEIKDIFPAYGNGFLAACLDVYNDNPEEVIQHILEGTLHPDLLSLDTTLQVKPTTKQSSNRSAKGKEKLDESAYLSQVKSNLDGSNSKNIIVAASSSVETMKSSLSPDAKFRATGRYVRRSNDDVNSASVLDQKDLKDSFRSAILATQYEDEYDDSFDELGTGVADSGIEEIESLGYRLSLQRAQRWRTDSTIDEAGSSRKLKDSLDDSTKRENSVNTSNNKLISEVSNSDIQDSAPSVPKMGHGSYSKGKYKAQQKPQFYVKDGKNYSYKVAGAVAVSSAEEAETLRKVQEETIHGLGPGGNVPLKQIESSAGTENDHNITGNKATLGGGQRGRGGYGRGGVQGDKAACVRKNNDNHHRKDRAMKKHFSGLGGY
ncbi:hypothetical protein SUGI_0262160 [Cryptomeria japonica]|uniref:uncharacterized protein LOC131035078 n=1 Tax=Cryptomeria japonica TaxID=3369 RepID=UPI002408C329|nr:uncharacterized protein LOC131035078 [Cryptomeria japonica]GLJ15877.1 hypothetical protein SUGI_0262160 [Cryptomeria japonica]